MNDTAKSTAPDNGQAIAPLRGWASNLLYDLTFYGGGAFFNLGWSLRTEGMHNTPRSGPVLVIANHQSFFDPVLIGMATRRRLCFLARKSLFGHTGFRWLIRSLNAVPIDQEGIGIEGLRAATRLLEEGLAVLVFPEGERTSDGAIAALKPGISLLVKRCRAPIVPVGLAGAYHAWPNSRALPMPSPLCMPATKRTIAISVAEPIEPGSLSGLSREAIVGRLTDLLHASHDRAEGLRRKDEA
jgi:1-acyl-sn-glycerol-3-phosphate acyltransferase